LLVLAALLAGFIAIVRAIAAKIAIGTLHSVKEVSPRLPLLIAPAGGAKEGTKGRIASSRDPDLGRQRRVDLAHSARGWATSGSRSRRQGRDRRFAGTARR